MEATRQKRSPKAGLANLVASLMNEGTKNKTPEQLEDAIGLLGASIRVGSGDENISISVSTLAKNFEKTIALVEEMLLEPRWDEEQFALAKSRIINSSETKSGVMPDYLASTTLNKLIVRREQYSCYWMHQEPKNLYPQSQSTI